MDEFLKYWHSYMLEHPALRVGQSLYVAALKYSKPTGEFAVEANSTYIDPFYQDERVLDFLNQMKEKLF